MPTPTADRLEVRNVLLRDLPEDESILLRPHLQHVSLVITQIVHEAGSRIEDVFFVEGGVVSLTADTRDNGLVEVGMTGREGVVGGTVLLNARAISVHRALVQVPGTAHRISAAKLLELIGQLPTLRQRIFLFLDNLLAQSGQFAACHARHDLPERLARWLLMSLDRVDGDELPMTQEFLSFMLGVRRAGVSVVANALQSQGLIRQSRGRLTVLDRAGLEREACSCYRIIERLQDGRTDAF